MITVYFETNSYSEMVATFVDEATYMACLPALERLAKEARMTISESVEEAV
jgi:hypothetical protein